jgi:hypothetical protein
MTRAVQRVGEVKKMLRIGNKALRLGAALFTGNASAITSAISAAIAASGVDDDE